MKPNIPNRFRIKQLLGATTALLLASPAMGALTLTNGDFSSGSTGWSTLTGFTSSLYNTTGGVATVPNTATSHSLYQDVVTGTSTETAATIQFDFTLNAFSTAGGRDFDFRLTNGADGGLGSTVALIVNGSHQLQLFGGAVSIFTGSSALTVGTTYTITLDMFGMDGNGGATGTVNGSILNHTTSITDSFSGTNANIASFDGLAFRKASGWTSNQQIIDNITVVPEPTAALLGSLGMLALLRRRRN